LSPVVDVDLCLGYRYKNGLWPWKVLRPKRQSPEPPIAPGPSRGRLGFAGTVVALCPYGLFPALPVLPMLGPLGQTQGQGGPTGG
jgi:hypothetical protein